MWGLDFRARRAGVPESKNRFTLAMALVVRKVVVATAVAVTVLGWMEFAVFTAASFLLQVPIFVAALALFRPARSSSPRQPNAKFSKGFSPHFLLSKSGKDCPR